jgi:DNA repair protein RadA
LNFSPDSSPFFNTKSNKDSFSLDLLPNLPDDMINLLKESGFLSIKDLVIEGPFEISTRVGISIEDSTIIYNQSITFLEDLGIMEKRFTPATTLYHKEKKLEGFLLVLTTLTSFLVVESRLMLLLKSMGNSDLEKLSYVILFA